MREYAGIDGSLEYSSVCVVDADGRIVREAKILSEPDALIAWFGAHGVAVERIGLEAGPLSQWLYAGMAKAGLCVELIETRHVTAARANDLLFLSVPWQERGRPAARLNSPAPASAGPLQFYGTYISMPVSP